MSLPSGYKRLEYIESSRTQYIDTKVKPTVNTKFSFGVYMLEQTGDCIIGNFLNDNNDYRIFNYSGSIYWDFKDSRIIGTAGSFPKNTYFEFECGNNYVKKNGQQVLTGQNISAFTADANIFAFSNGASARCSGRLYFLKIFDGESLIRDFVPCINGSGEVGLYDLVGKQFYGNAGTGTFTAGPIVVSQSEITKLEYIQSSGTQYINTGFKPNNNTRVVMDLLYTGSESISNEFGAWNSSNNASFICLTTGENNLYPFYGNTSKQVSANRTVRHTVDMDKNVVKMNGTTMITFDQMSFQCIYPMFLCCFNNAGATENMTSMRIYSCQIYDNGTLIRNYIPAKLSDGIVGLYDKLNGLLYINSGTGTFEAGPVVASPSIFVNIDGIWKPINHIYVNINNIWQKST